ncbi:MAG TPA: cation:proton antiporter, partial [Puia sp.]
MHGILPFLLAMIAAIVLLEMLATKLRVAYPIVLVVAGLLISFIPGLPAIRVNPELIFFIVLPPLLADAAWNISFKEMKKWWRIISSFAFLVVLFTALAVASFYGIDAKEHYVTLTDPQIKVRVLEIGDGEPLVIVPGNTGDAFVLASLMTELKGRRIYAINRPGGGLSE